MATGKFDIKLYQKEENIYVYIPYRSVHQEHTIVNFVIEELNRYVKCNSTKLYFLINKLSFYKRLLNRGYKKTFLNKTFAKVSYKSRNELLKLQLSVYGACQQDGAKGEDPLHQLMLKNTGEKKKEDRVVPDITLNIGGQFITLQDDLKKTINKQIQDYSSICPICKEFAATFKIRIIFNKSTNLGNLIVKTKLI